jgi:hypothetical protein
MNIGVWHQRQHALDGDPCIIDEHIEPTEVPLCVLRKPPGRIEIRAVDRAPDVTALLWIGRALLPNGVCFRTAERR